MRSPAAPSWGSGHEARGQGSGFVRSALLLALMLASPLGASALASNCASPSGPSGVLTVVNKIRAQFKAQALVWNATLATRAQLHANKCLWEHSSIASRQWGEWDWDGENIYRTWGTAYPIDGHDACAYADIVWASQVSSYNFDQPNVPRHSGDTKHFSQLVWDWTQSVGCGYAVCPTMAGAPQAADFVVCQYHKSGNWLDFDMGYSWYKENVRRTDCMKATGDDWCSACSGTTCTACYPRGTFSGAASDPILLDARTGKCVSKCDPKVTGCKGGCLVDNSTCVDSVVVPPPIVGGGGPVPTKVGRSCVNAPTASSGVLTLTNALRKRHNVAALTWNVTMAARAMEHAGKCVFANSAQSTRNNDAELIFRTVGVTYPKNNLDACGFATQDWYNEATSYNFASPGRSRDEGITRDFTQLVWKGTKQMGCGFAACSGMDFVVCQYDPPGNLAGATQYSTNVMRTACQTATRDDWCATCTAGTSPVCSTCISRATYAGGPVDKISLDATTKKCASKCPCGSASSANCALCTYSGACLRCNAGWAKNLAGQCLLRDCPKLYGTGCTGCTGIACTACASGFKLNLARTGCTRLSRRRLRSLPGQ